MPDWTDHCAACPRKLGLRAIGGDGPRPASVLGILERPGQDENRNGRVACGKTGQELDELYLPLAGLSRPDIRLCNTVLCGHESNKAPTPKEIAQCAPHHLPREIERTQPDLIILMGSTPCSLVPGIKLDMHHGIPQHTRKVGDLFGWQGWLLPMFHPAIGLHESRFMQVCMDDWQSLKEYLDTGFEDDPPAKTTFYRYVSGAAEVSAYMRNAGNFNHQPAMDTESHGKRVWSMQVSVATDTGLLVRADDREGMGAIDYWFDKWPYDVAMHHAAHDLEEARQVSVRVPRRRDTMQEAFHLGNLPQGLKALTYRLFRHTMTSYEETVRPASIRKLQEWLTEAYCVAAADLATVTQRFHKKTGKRLTDDVRKSEVESLLTRLLQKTDPDSEYDPWGGADEPRLNAFWQDAQNQRAVAHIENRLGPYPISGIANCTMDEAVRYAVGDADWTGRVAVELERRRQGAFQIYEGDRDA